MNKKFLYGFVLILCVAVSGSSAFAAITVEDATVTWEAALEAPTALIEASGKVESRIVVEYATAIYEDALAEPSDLLEASDKAESRIVVEYATSIYEDSLEEPDVLLEASEKVSPRIVVEYSTAVFKADMLYPFEPVPGDLSRNGLVDVGDAVRIFKIICGDKSVTVYEGADFSKDGRIGLEDAIILFQVVAR